MGGRETGGMANLLPAHRDLGNPQHRAEVAELWKVDDIPSTAGKTAVEMFDAVRQGEIKILWIVCTNPAQSMPDQHLIREALTRAELVIVQEAYRGTATMAYADVVFPAASWGEKSGTVTNSERRITRVKAALPPYAQAKPDWEIATSVALKLAQKLERSTPYFSYADSEEIWNEHRQTTAGRDLDITGLSYAILEERGAQQWPYPKDAESGTHRLYTDADIRYCKWQSKIHRHAVFGAQRKNIGALSILAQHRSSSRPMAWHESHGNDRPTLCPRARTHHSTVSERYANAFHCRW